MRYAAVESVWSSVVLLTNANIGLAPLGYTRIRRPPTVCEKAIREVRILRENQEFQDELSIPMEIRGLRTDQGNEASKPESANNSKHQWRRGSVPSDDRIMKHEGRQEAEGSEV
ncbi:hypothetical protein E4U39_000682 [Claviceps sp. Clav50 group G5]|nr:hypothetical protein E4U39_000682 [Claviceps sp. Clav50 group G5]